ncbi:MAG: response regulator [Chloroflexi bacterium]|nr:response regulator [Chloroflexota bacterium]
MAGKTILVVDDETQARKLIALVLLRQGYTVIEASSGQEALELTMQHDVDLILLDLMMPGMDGIAVTRQLRAEPRTAEIAVVMFTARGMVDDKVEGFEAGVDDYLTKPVHPADLTARIKAILASREPDE